MKPITKLDATALISAFVKAQAAANALKSTEDGGTCNFDSCVIIAGRDSTIIERAAEAACVSAHSFTWIGRKAYWVGDYSGQGLRRTKMAEAFCASLRASGVDATMYYKMD